MAEDVKIVIAASTDKVTKAINTVGEKLEGLKSKAGSAFSGMLSANIVFAGLQKGAEILQNVVSGLDDLGKKSARLEIDSTSLQAAEEAYKHAGLSADDVEKHIVKLNNAMDGAASGQKTYTDAFDKLGISWKDLQGMDTAERLRTVVNALNNMPDKAQASAAAFDLLGKSGPKILALAGDYDALTTAAKNSGNLIDEANIKAAEKMTDAVQDLKKAFIAMIAKSAVLTSALKIIDGYSAYFGNAALIEQQAAKQKNGMLNRSEAAIGAIDKAEKSGRYTKTQIQYMKDIAADYGAGKGVNNQGTLIDMKYGELEKAMREFGYGGFTRPKPRGVWQFEGSSEYGYRHLSKAEKAVEDEKRRIKLKAEWEAKQAAAAAAEAARRRKINDAASANADDAYKFDAAGRQETKDDYVKKRFDEWRTMKEKQRQRLVDAGASVEDIDAATVSKDDMDAARSSFAAEFDKKQADKNASSEKALAELVSSAGNDTESLKRQLKYQQMKAKGQIREAELEQLIFEAKDKANRRLAEAEAKAKAAGRDLTDAERSALAFTDAQASLITQNYDASHKQTDKLSTTENLDLVSAKNSYSYAAMGARLGGASSAEKSINDSVKTIKAEIALIRENMPTASGLNSQTL